MKGLFWLTSSCLFLFLLASMIGAAITGSEKIAEPKVPIAWAGKAWGWFQQSAKDSNQNNPNSDEDFGDVANDAIRKFQRHVDEAKEKVGSDPRLSICKNGSVENLNLKEIPEATAIAFKEQVDGGKRYSWMDLQSALGQPACNQRMGSKISWRFLVEGMRVIDAQAEASGGDLKITFTNF